MQAPAQAPQAMPAAAPVVALPDGFQDSIAGVYSLIPMLQGLQLNAVERKQLDEAGQALETLRVRSKAHESNVSMRLYLTSPFLMSLTAEQGCERLPEA